MKLVSIVGARPQFVKLAAIERALPKAINHVILHTGQHYDERLSQVFFEELKIHSEVVNLGIGSGSHGWQTARMMEEIEGFLRASQPDQVVVFGDTNSTIAGALVTRKMGIPLTHLEAGLRSFNRRMPEEVNRTLSDHAADLCLAPSEAALTNLAVEGLEARSVFVGDVMFDLHLSEKKRVMSEPPKLPWTDPVGTYAVATLHREELMHDEGRLKKLVSLFQESPVPVKLCAHPRLRQSLKNFSDEVERGNLELHVPLSYSEMLWALANAKLVVTDSGGLQKEAFWLNKPTITVRNETEWPETVTSGWNRLVWADMSKLVGMLSQTWEGTSDGDWYGTGKAAEKSVQALLSHTSS